MDRIKATVFDVDNVHPHNADFASGGEGKILISALHGGGYYTPYQTTNALVRVAASVKPVPIDEYPNLRVYFEVTDPDDLSHYEGKTVPGTSHVQGDNNPNDNRDPDRRMTTGTGQDYAKYQVDCLGSSRSSALVVTNQTAIAETVLQITNRYAGDNYQVRATLQKPHNQEPFDTRTSWTTNQAYTVSSISESATMIAWKRVYVEQDSMYSLGATLTADAAAGATNLTVDAVSDFKAGDPVAVFWKTGGHHAQIVARNPVVALTGGGGTGASAEAAILSGAVSGIEVTAAGSGYTTVPAVSVAGNPGGGASAQARLTPTSVGAIAVTSGGSGYATAPTVTLSPPHVSGGVQATATATVNSGQVTGITVTQPGSGYEVPPTVAFSGGGGVGAIAAAGLTPTSVLRIDVAQGGSGYVPNVTIAPPLPQAVMKFSGLRPAAEPPTYQVDRRYLPQAFGHLPDGSDGGAFIEFKDAPTGSGKVPKYAVFPHQLAEEDYADYWFNGFTERHENILHILAARREISGSLGVHFPIRRSCIVYVIDNVGLQPDGTSSAPDIQRDETLVHEIGHRFGLNPNAGGMYLYIDQTGNNELSHNGIEICIMSYDNFDNGMTEFSIDCLFNGSSHGSHDSLREAEDK